MAASELSLEEIHEYLVQKGGIVSNRDCVRHFRRYLTDPASKDEARNKFKKYVNVLATTKTEGDEKFLILRAKYSSALDLQSAVFLPASPQYDPRNSIGIPVSPTASILSDYSPISSPVPRQPPPYRPPPPVSSPNTSSLSQNISFQESPAPKAPPRRKSSDQKAKFDLEQNTNLLSAANTSTASLVSFSDDKENEGSENKQTVSVKERTQKFNRLASHEEESTSPRPKDNKKKQVEKKGADEEDGAAVTSLDPKRCAQWYVSAAKCDYQELAKLAHAEPRLVKLKDPFTTVLHWGAKHGNPDVIKLFAGTYKANINAKSNGGYTPLHIAAKYGRAQVYELMKDVYRADLDMRDNSGRKPIYYITSQRKVGTNTTHKLKGRKKQTDKELGFLRIGSLNVRVKKTTEAFSNFLGVGGGSINPIDPINDKVHKGWGSADNIGQENGVMPAPKGYISKRKSKRPSEFSGTSSTPGTPSQVPRAIIHRNSMQDSDSDTAAGFDSNWQN